MYKICDAHNDLLYLKKEEIENYKNNLPDFAEKIFCAYFSYDNTHASVEDMKNKFETILTEKMVPTVENCWFITENNLDAFIQTKPFCATLTHNKTNHLAGGAMEQGDVTNFGKKVIRAFEKNKIVVDLAHLNKNSFYQVINESALPLFCSHTGFTYIFDHPRNLDDAQIKEVKNSGGYIGMAFYPTFFNLPLSTEQLTDIICNFWEKYGTDTLGLGTDFNGITVYLEEIKGYQDMPILAKNLEKRGASRKEIESFFSKNLLSFMQKIKNITN